MAKDREAGRLISPENLWAKPLPGAKKEPAQPKATRMREEDEDNMEDEDIDVDAELAAEDSYGEEAEEDADADEELVAEDTSAVGEEPDEDDDEDEIDYESEEGDEEVAAEDATETSASALAADDVDEDGETEEGSEVAALSKESRTPRMAEKKKTSLSDHIRNEIEKRKASGASMRGVDIVTALEKRGINVSAAQVSQLLKKAGLSSGKRGRPTAAKAGDESAERPRAALKAAKKPADEPKPRATVSRKPTAEPTRMAPKAAPKAGNGFSVPMDQLSAAADFVAACGGSFDKATRILDAASKLSQTFGG